MKASTKVVAGATVAVALLGAAGTAAAQARTTDRSSWLPGTSAGYVGLSVGRSNYDSACGTGFDCDDHDTAWKVYTGASVNPWLGVELGYIEFGDVGRAGGMSEAQGLNLSLVATLPVGESFRLYGKLGATYGRTKVSAAAGSGVTPGTRNGLGPAIAIGGGFDINRDWTAVLEWEHHNLRFAGTGREGVSATTLGIRYNF